MSWLTNSRKKAIRLTRAASTTIAFSLLAACGSRPQPEPRTVRVDVPVLVPCRVQPVEVPVWAAASIKPGDDLQTKVRALLAERRQRIGYEGQLRAAVMACSDLPTP